MVLIFLIVQLTVSLIIGGPSIPAWMFINSMNLVVHLPLIRSNMPPNAQYFLKHYLDIFRVNLEFVNENIDSAYVNIDLLTSLMIDLDSYDT